MNKIESSSAHKWIEKERGVWIKAHPSYPNPHEDAFLEGKVVDIYKDDALVLLIQSHDQFRISLDNCLKLTYGINDVCDMVDLEELNEPELLYNIKRRYFNDLIFTYCGPTLLIINPYAHIDKLFNEALLQEYQTQVFTENLEYKHLTPHIFGLSAFCLWQLFENERNQSIVISGESGAGKTENTKYCLKFLASLGKNMKDLILDKKKVNSQLVKSAEKAIKKTSTKLNGIEDRILGCNEILEAFGNSKTIRNDNSSRFGKLILLLYGQTQIDIRSALITSYLLEKSRIVSISDGERNYHVFYYFCKGTSPEERKKYLLKDPINKYYYLNQSTVYEVKAQSDEQKFEALKQQFEQYLTPDEIVCVLKILSIVLNIGNLLFKKTETKDNEETAQITNEEYLRNVAQLLEVDYQPFKHNFQFKTRKLGTSIIDSPLKYDEVIALRDSFAKNIYQRCFNFLVEKLNEKIQIQKIDLDNETKSSRTSRKSIGILDIFGFQVLGINTLEQFFINFANEKLQQLYVSYIFKEEQNEFLKQGLKEFSHDIGFQDNKPVIDLFELYPLGIFHLINESSELNKPDEELPSAINRNHPKNPFISIPISKRGLFQINHSCSPVTYNTNSFTAKNKDEFPNQILKVIENMKQLSMKSIIMGKPDTHANRTSSSKKFLGSKFMNEMNKLTEELYNCDCHFVRCIKPNNVKSPKVFNSSAVLQSLRYLGVLDSIIIRKLGYIYRRPFKQFHKKFYQLEHYSYDYQSRTKDMSEDEFKEDCKRIVEKYMKKELGQKNILFGVKKIMIKESTLNTIELLLKEKRRLRVTTTNRLKVMYLHAVFRRKVTAFIHKIKILKAYSLGLAHIAKQTLLLKKTIKLQYVIRKFLWQRRLEKIKQQATKSVTRIACNYKMTKQRKLFLAIRQKTIQLQSCCRAFICAGKFIREKRCKMILMGYFEVAWEIIMNRKAIMIQKVWKGAKTRKLFKKQIEKIKKNIILKKIKIKFKNALFAYKYKKFQMALQKYKKPILMLQAEVRRRYCSRVYQKLRRSVILIQKVYRKHLAKKFYLSKLWNQYKSYIKVAEQKKREELSLLGVKKCLSKIYHVDETIRIPFLMYPNQLMNSYLNDYNHFFPNYKINQTYNSMQKNTMQAYIGDLDLISDVYCGGNWLKKFIQTKQQMSQKGEYPLSINICDGFTTLISSKDKIYCFQNQLNVSKHQNCWKKIQINGTPKLIQTNENLGYLVTTEKKLYSWGCNVFQNYESKQEHKIMEIANLKNINQLSIKGQNMFFLNNDGKVYQKLKKSQSLSTQVFLKHVIIQIASSYQFIHFLSSLGELYSKGSNYYGQLGLGYCSQNVVAIITPNIYLKNKKQIIQNVSVGIAHTVVKSKLGYVYSWGDNSFKQINSQDVTMFHTPTQIEVEKQKIKVVQAIAGSRASYFLTENLKIIANGTSSCFPTPKNVQGFQLQLLNETSLISKRLMPVKIMSSWTNTMSILVINAIDITKCKQGIKNDMIAKYCKTIAKEWKSHQVYPDYHEWMDNILKISEMRKFKFANHSTKVAKKNNEPQNQLDEIKMLMELRKTSQFFKQSTSKKIYSILERLNSTPKQKWTYSDEQLSTYISTFCMNIFK